MKAAQRTFFAACWVGAAGFVTAETSGGFDFAATPPSLTFHGAVGEPTATQSVTIAASAGNTGTVTFTGCTFGGSHPASFSFSPAPTFPLNVAAGASINLPIRFIATALGPRNASFSCESANGTAVGGSFPISLNGTGVINTLTTTPALNFPATLLGTTSAPLNVTATAGAGNTGNVTITSCTIGGTHAGDFIQAPPVTNISISPGASVLVPVTFSPAAGDARNATLTCNLTNGPVSTFTVALTGTGTTPAQTTARVSVASGGVQGDGHSYAGPLSADGRHVVFVSRADNLAPGDVNGMDDVFVHDRQTNQTQRVSVMPGGSGGFGPSFGGALSADGRHVAFVSSDDTLVSGDTNNLADVFVHDRQTNQTQRVSVASGGGQASGPSFSVALSADGRHVAFTASASNLVAGDTNVSNDVFVHDRQTGQTQRVNVRSDGGEAFGTTFDPGISADGRYVTFASDAFNLVLDDSNGEADVFVRDRQTNQTQRVSVSSGGGQANFGSGQPSLSADGRYVAFASLANDLVPGDTNGMMDVFVHDRWTGQTQRISQSMSAGPANGPSTEPMLSADGRHVAYASDASNLVPNDTNGETDVFVHDRQSGQTERASVVTGGWEAGEPSWEPYISADGRHVAFSTAGILVADDTNDSIDVYVRDRGPQDVLFSDGFE